MTPPSLPRPGRAVLALLLVTVLWGWTFLWMKQATGAVDAALGPAGAVAGVSLFMTLRFGLAALLLPLLVPPARRHLDGAAWRGGLILGALLLAGFLLQMFGLRGVSPPVSAFLTSLYVLFTALLHAAHARRAPGWPLFLGVLLATFGGAYISGPPQVSFDAPEWLTVACAAIFAVHILATDAVTRRVRPLPVSTTTFAWVALGSALVFAAGMLRDGAPSASALLGLLRRPDFWAPLLLSSTLATVVALTLMNQFQRDLPPVRAAILYALEPVWASIFSIALGRETPNLWLFAGGAALLLGNLVAELGPWLKNQRSAAAG
ncbi:MAG: DMT family transporter [Planctomycetota bacterium]|nr:MAG: DMT family transporter [Planctomycetota bacterium]